MMRINTPSNQLRTGILPVLLLVLLTSLALGQLQRYRDQGDGTVDDTRSRLIWLANASCWKPMSWEDAQAAVAKLKDGMCGLTDGSKPGDWRLPTQREWRAMVDCACADVALQDNRGTGCHSADESAFNGVKSGEYWSSTVLTINGDERHVVMSLHDGFDDTTSAQNSFLVWPVRRASASTPPGDGGR